MLKFLKKYFTGHWAIPIKNRFILLPRLAPLFTVALILAFLGDVNKEFFVSIAGWSLVAVSIFCFFLNRLFPNIK